MAAPATSASSAAGRRAIATVCSIGSGRGQAHGWGAGSTAAAPASECDELGQPEPSTAVVPAQKRMMRTSGRSSCGQAGIRARGGEWGVSGRQLHDRVASCCPPPWPLGAAVAQAPAKRAEPARACASPVALRPDREAAAQLTPGPAARDRAAVRKMEL